MQRAAIHINTYPMTSTFPGLDIGKTPHLTNIPYSGGWHVRLAEQMQKLTNAWSFECWGLDTTLKEPLRWEKDGIVFRLFPARTIKYVGSFSRQLVHELKKEAKRREVLIHIHDVFNWTTFVVPLAIKRTPIVVQHHGSLSSLQQARNAPTRRLAVAYALHYLLTAEWFFERASFPKLDHVFILNKPAAQYLGQFVQKARIETLTMGIDFNTFIRRDRSQARRALGLDVDARYVLYVGSFVRVKGISYLLTALPAILERQPHAVLILLGSGYYRAELVKYVRRLGIEDNVLFRPSDEAQERIDDRALPLYYNAADVVVLPSLNEGLAVVGIEALASETPLVTTDVGGMPELVNVFRAGTLIPPRRSEALSQAVLAVLSDAHQFAVDRKNAEQHYAWKRIAQRNLEVYSDLVNKHSK